MLAQNRTRTAQPVAAQPNSQVMSAPKATVDRLFFLDNLRWALTILVILHHLSITYGAEGSWYYVEQPTNEVAQLILTLFTGLNQGYFMGLFFLIAGYFVPVALDRKGVTRFLKERGLRLGVPLVFFALVISPAMNYFQQVRLNSDLSLSSFWRMTLTEWRHFDFEFGPLWFVETLLIFSLIYALGSLFWPRVSMRGDAEAHGQPDVALTNSKLILFALLIAIVSFATRLVFPVGAEWNGLQLGFFPQYIALFAAGIWAYRNQWLPDLPVTLWRRWQIVVLVAILALPLMMVTLGPEPDLALVFGGWHWQAFAFAVWEAFYAIAMSITLLSLFRRRFDRQNTFSHTLSTSAYTVYIIHAPVIVALAYAVQAVTFHPLLKFALLAGPAVALCFALAYLILRYGPGVRRIL